MLGMRAGPYRASLVFSAEVSGKVQLLVLTRLLAVMAVGHI